MSLLLNGAKTITIAGTSTALGGTISAATIGNAIGAFSSSAQVSGITNAQLANNSVTVTAGTDLSGGGTASLGGTITLNVVGNGPFQYTLIKPDSSTESFTTTSTSQNYNFNTHTSPPNFGIASLVFRFCRLGQLESWPSRILQDFEP